MVYIRGIRAIYIYLNFILKMVYMRGIRAIYIPELYIEDGVYKGVDGGRDPT